MSKIICCSSSGLTLYSKLIFNLVIDRVQCTHSIRHLEQSSGFPLGTNAPVQGGETAAALSSSAVLSHTCTTAVHTYRHSCWQPSSPGIIQGWVLSNKAKIRVSVGAPDVCRHGCSQQCPIQHFLFILHLRQLVQDLPDLFAPWRASRPSPPAAALAALWGTAAAWGPRVPARQQGKGLEGGSERADAAAQWGDWDLESDAPKHRQKENEDKNGSLTSVGYGIQKTQHFQ